MYISFMLWCFQNPTNSKRKQADNDKSIIRTGKRHAVNVHVHAIQTGNNGRDSHQQGNGSQVFHRIVQAVIQNLKDAGCDKKTVERFMELEEEGKTKEQLDLLANHRRQLLDRVHKEEKRINCLDYLVYQMQKQKPAV